MLKSQRMMDMATGVLERDGYVFPTANADYQITIRDRVVRATISGANTPTFTLPPVAEAVGLTITVSVDRADTAALTLEDYGSVDSFDWGGDYTLDADEDRITLYSDGRTWVVVDNQIA